MFNKNVTEFLSRITRITNTAILKYPTTVFNSEGNDVLVSLDISRLDSSEFPDIGLNNSLGDFLSLVGMFSDTREIEVTNKSINIRDGDLSSSFVTNNIAVMDEKYNRDTKPFDITDSVPTVAEFKLGPDDFKKIMQASKVFSDLSELVFTSKDDKIEISLTETNKFNLNTNKFNIVKHPEKDILKKDFCVKVPVENIKMLPASEYIVEIKYNSSRDMYRLLLKSESFDGFRVLLLTIV